jgi:ppGpp synthetase/RelA/SpoT-type nucleotidyltranferase
MTAPVPSITRVNKAGDVLRSVLFNATSHTALADLDLDAFNAAFDLLVAWRTAHATPLRKATMGLRSRVATARCAQIEVSQRLKRTPTIIDKLRREPGMELGRMADIGGCRAVLQDLDELARVRERYERAPDRIVRTRDHIEEPKPDGYRALHIYVRYDARLVEVQLRTRIQHEWAYTVETIASRLGLDIKGGAGPEPVRAWFAAVSAAMAVEEHGDEVSPDLLENVSTLKQQALPYLRGGHR